MRKLSRVVRCFRKVDIFASSERQPVARKQRARDTQVAGQCAACLVEFSVQRRLDGLVLHGVFRCCIQRGIHGGLVCTRLHAVELGLIRSRHQAIGGRGSYCRSGFAVQRCLDRFVLHGICTGRVKRCVHDGLRCTRLDVAQFGVIRR